MNRSQREVGKSRFLPFLPSYPPSLAPSLPSGCSHGVWMGALDWISVRHCPDRRHAVFMTFRSCSSKFHKYEYSLDGDLLSHCCSFMVFVAWAGECVISHMKHCECWELRCTLPPRSLPLFTLDCHRPGAIWLLSTSSSNKKPKHFLNIWVSTHYPLVTHHSNLSLLFSLSFLIRFPTVTALAFVILDVQKSRSRKMTDWDRTGIAVTGMQSKGKWSPFIWYLIKRKKIPNSHKFPTRINSCAVGPIFRHCVYRDLQAFWNELQRWDFPQERCQNPNEMFSDELRYMESVLNKVEQEDYQ